MLKAAWVVGGLDRGPVAAIDTAAVPLECVFDAGPVCGFDVHLDLLVGEAIGSAEGASASGGSA